MEHSPFSHQVNRVGGKRSIFLPTRFDHNLPKNTPICLYIHFYFLYSLFEIYSSTRFIKNERKSNVSFLYFIISESNIVDPKLE